MATATKDRAAPHQADDKAAPGEVDGDDAKPAKPSAHDVDHCGLEPKQMLDLLSRMMTIRRFEERTMQAYTQQKIGGFCHIYIGQEAVAVGSAAAAKADDPVIGAYRDHGLAIARDMEPKYVMAEMFGRITGCSKGKGGSMHMFDKPHHMYGGHAIVGGQLPLAAGLGFAVQYNREEKVCVCYLGDGALNQGSFHESMNLAAIYNLPIVFALENNAYSMGTHINRGTSMADDLASKAESHGMRYAQCDGTDVLDVYKTFTTEIEKTRGSENPQWVEDRPKDEVPTYSRQGQTPGPVFINVDCHRYEGHSMSDPQKYRNKDQVKAMSKDEERDPIRKLVSHLIENDLATQEQIDQLDEQAKQTAKDAIAFAEQSDPVGMDEMYTDVYVNPFGKYKKGEMNPAFEVE